MMKTACLLLCVSAFSGVVRAEDSCAGLEGSALTQCRSNQQTLRQQEQLERQLQQQEARQNELDKQQREVQQQQREVQQQLESMRLQNETLRKQLERESAIQAARPVATDYPKSAEVRNAEINSWRADNPWYGTDYARTQFATRYIKQLQKERPDLTGRDLLDALSAKVNETFGRNR
jgi:chromosome segregation ATPase